MTPNKVTAIFGGVVGLVFTRLPYMEDGNLLITTVCVIFFAFSAVILKVMTSILFNLVKKVKS